MTGFFTSAGIAVAGILSHYDIPFGDEVSDRLVVIAFLATPALLLWKARDE